MVLATGPSLSPSNPLSKLLPVRKSPSVALPPPNAPATLLRTPLSNPLVLTRL